MILVTGAAGYIGSHTWVKLIDSGIEVVGVDNFSNSNPLVIDRIKKITNSQSLNFFDININNKVSLRRIFNSFPIDAVIHFAAHKSVFESICNPQLYYKNNIGGLMNLVEIMDAFDCKNIIYSSSACVYGLKNKSPLKEGLSLSPINPYGETKMIGEMLLNNLISLNWHVGILRYFNPIGAHASGEIGESPNNVPQNLMPFLLQVASGKIDSLKVFGGDYPTKDGTAIRDYIHIEDLAQAHIKGLNYLSKTNESFTLNLGNGSGFTVLDVIHTFQKVNNVKISYKIEARRDGDVDICFADSSKAHRLLNWNPAYSLEDMCRSAWLWQTRNPNGYNT